MVQIALELLRLSFGIFELLFKDVVEAAYLLHDMRLLNQASPILGLRLFNLLLKVLLRLQG